MYEQVSKLTNLYHREETSFKLPSQLLIAKVMFFSMSRKNSKIFTASVHNKAVSGIGSNRAMV